MSRKSSHRNKTDAREDRLQKNGQEPRFEQQEVPLIGHEDLPGVHDGKVIEEEQDERRFLSGCVRASDGGHAGDHGAAPDDGFQAEFAVYPPENRRHLPESVGSELAYDFGRRTRLPAGFPERR